MITRRNYLILAGVTLALLVPNAIIGSGKDVLWVLDDVLWFGFLLSVLLLIVMTVAILVRAATSRSRDHAGATR
ncbi:hypothetical protein [Nocardioides marmoribigeumensis]|jgi:hypothetical protein|uniref:Uncharacterized protein n=1 Tax=Nocardioides marmoribigeumensis TaxID=433649 RepID=A0ABU2BSE8_9ACTN|nr:hypothetical protein [Nocardioides marmoribigeumensis]MDR7361568.1 hypothetical protein [Nocardioides marmoribigeumensis]